MFAIDKFPTQKYFQKNEIVFTNLISWTFDEYQQIFEADDSVKLLDSMQIQQICGIINQTNFGIHPENKHGVSIESIKQYNFHQMLISYMADRLSTNQSLEDPVNINMITQSLKFYLNIEYAKLVNQLHQNYSKEERREMKINICDVVSLRKEARYLYVCVQHNIIKHIKYFKYPGELIKVLFELC